MRERVLAAELDASAQRPALRAAIELENAPGSGEYAALQVAESARPHLPALWGEREPRFEVAPVDVLALPAIDDFDALRPRPVLMTALVASVVIGGIVSSTLLTLLVLYAWAHRRARS